MNTEASELVIYLNNEPPLSKQKFVIYNKLAKKKKKGNYDPKKAPKAFATLLTTAAKKYMKEFGSPGDKWNITFSAVTRRQASVRLAEEFQDWYSTDFKG